MRLIDAEKLTDLEKLKYIYWFQSSEEIGHEPLYRASDVWNILEEAPTINPEDLRLKGRWIYLGESYFDTVYKCSECGHPEKMNKKCKKNYCPNCGAKTEE